MKIWIIVSFVILTTCGCSPESVFTLQDRTDLGAYLAYNIVLQEDIPDPDVPDGKPGDKCPECDGRGVIGDGTIEYKCNSCNGTGVIPDTGAVSEDTEDVVESTANDIKIVHIEQSSDSIPTAQVERRPVKRMSSTKWTVNKKSRYTTEELSKHLQKEHKINTDGYSRDELQIMHDNIHNGYPPHGS